jgi:hypothetical protein
VPISAATVSHITSNRPPAPPASTFPIERASNDLGISVDADARSRALAARLKVGARVGTNTRFEVAQDSQVLASSDIGRCTDGSVNAVVRGRRLSPDELFDAYQSQMSGQERGLKTAKHSSGRTTVLEALDDFNRVVVVARDGSKPTALLTECGDA